jgi:hypothetical protein
VRKSEREREREREREKEKREKERESEKERAGWMASAGTIAVVRNVVCPNETFCSQLFSPIMPVLY